MAFDDVSNVEITFPDSSEDFSADSRYKSNSASHRPLSVYTRLLRNRSGNIINRIFSAKRSKSNLNFDGSSSERSNPNYISIGIQTTESDEEGRNCDQETSDQCDDAINETSQKNFFVEPLLNESEQPTDLENCLNGIKLNGNYSDVSESDMEVEDDDSLEDESIITINKPNSEIIKLPPIINSLFPEIPPFIRFGKDNEEIIPFSKSVSKKLIWRNSQITPNVLKRALERSHFKLTNRTSTDWIGYFGRHIPSALFRQLKEYQKLNHIPGSFELGRKDQLTRNINKIRNRFCGDVYNFYPATFLLPPEYSMFKNAYRHSFNGKRKSSNTWIIKPPASSRGRGIYLASKLGDIPKRKKVVAQKYISDPYLINGNKFDLRLYVYVTSVDPLRIYIHRNGLVRFASQKYSVSQKEFDNKFVHLTNFSINKKNTNCRPPDEAPENFSHKWPLDDLWRYLKAKGHDTEKLWEDIKAIAFKTVATATFKMASMVAQHVRCRESAHEVFGFDVILDSKLRPWLLEVNISPSFHTPSKIDNDIKTEVVVDLLNVAGFRLPPKEETESNSRVQSSIPDSSKEGKQSELTNLSSTSKEDETTENQNLPFHKVDQLRYTLTDAEKAKHRFYSARTQLPSDIRKILDEPTKDDVLVLTTTVNEWYRASLGRFERIYPQSSPEAAKILNLIYMECDRLTQGSGSFRYYDALIFQFIQRYARNENYSVEEKDSSSNSPKQLGGQDLHLLSSTLGISVKGLMFIAKLSKERLSVDLVHSDLYGPSPFRKPSRPKVTKRFSKSAGRPSSFSDGFQTKSRFVNPGLENLTNEFAAPNLVSSE
nr:tubulin polyglutamylase ttll4 [Hymenolepis microstoma]